MKIYQRSLTWTIFVLKTLSSRANDDGRYSDCACFKKSDLFQYREDIILNKATLYPTSCDPEKKTASLRVQPLETWDRDDRHRSRVLQRRPGGRPGGGGPPPPGTDPKEFLHGWTVETFPSVELGSCAKTPGLKLGPYPIQQVQTCELFIHDECEMIKRAVCPCFDSDKITSMKEKIEGGDPKFVLDVEKSCKDPELNGGLPFGIYQRDVEIVLNGGRARSLSEPKKLYSGRASMLFNDELKMGVGNNPRSKKGECFDGSDKVYPQLDFFQLTHCENMMKSLCDSLELLPPSSDANADSGARDEVDFVKDGKSGMTCEWMTSTPKRKRKFCQRMNKQTRKHVFEHCRESCFAAPCVDDSDYRFNGQKDQDCDWIASHQEYCVDERISKRYCIEACGTECCKDNDEFKFEYQGKKNLTCNNVANLPKDSKGREVCDIPNIAVQCKMSCLKC